MRMMRVAMALGRAPMPEQKQSIVAVVSKTK